MAWLKQAVAAGYSNVENMKTDKDLDFLRDRTDFQRLLADLEAEQEKVNAAIVNPRTEKRAGGPDPPCRDCPNRAASRPGALPLGPVAPINRPRISHSIKGESHEPIHLVPSTPPGNEAARPGTPAAGAAGRPHGAEQLHGGDGRDLINDINAANAAGGSNTITLVAGTTFTLTAVDNTTDGSGNGLPVIAANDNLTIQGNGDTIARSTASGTPVPPLRRRRRGIADPDQPDARQWATCSAAPAGMPSAEASTQAVRSP